ncbi:hypothetical protein FisN_2Lh514 [Fistulifera solaris]|uniref:Uncharacterized protein n=1 Tax=Fistulifera solaris TaxID=1519565 RepID=A0A1Z5JAG0_FISSO|nr:hypothetical protein FisN_2Lh514 [Fistulifera solaris]|eukprot:GAX10984.1 hypothetical protein FisN_2Lh514 [Fistulifera solaris]
MHRVRSFSPYIASSKENPPCPVVTIEVAPLEGIDFRHASANKRNKPHGGLSTASATEISSISTTPSFEKSVKLSSSHTTTRASQVPSCHSPVSNQSRPRANHTSEEGTTAPDMETYKAMLKKTTRLNKKSPMRQQHHHSKESLANYKDLVAVQHRDARRKHKHLGLPPASIQY